MRIKFAIAAITVFAVTEGAPLIKQIESGIPNHQMFVMSNPDGGLAQTGVNTAASANAGAGAEAEMIPGLGGGAPPPPPAGPTQ